MLSSFSSVKHVLELRRASSGLLIASFGPILVLIFPALPFANNGHCDPWYVYGLFFNLPDQVHWRPTARQVGRLTETLPGYVVTHALPAVVSDYVLFLLFFTTATFFLYKAAALLLSPTRAAFATIFFAFSPIVIGNYAVTFSGPGLTYEILALYCGTRAIRCASNRGVFGWMFLSGIALGAGLQAHLAVMAFCCFVYFLFGASVFLELERDIQCRIKRIAEGAAAALVGLVAITAATSILASAMFGSKYWSIVLNQIEDVPAVLDSSARLFWQNDWFLTGPNIGMYSIIIGVGVAAIGIGRFVHTVSNRRGSLQQNRFEVAISAALGLTVLGLLVDASRQGVFLQYDYYYALLWPFLALAIFARPIDRDLKFGLIFVIFYAVVCCVCVAIKQYALPSWINDHQAVLSLVSGAVTVILLLALQRAPHPALVGVCLLGFGLSALVVRSQHMGTHPLWDRPNGSEWRNSYARINSGLKFLAETLGNGVANPHGPAFWVDGDTVSDGPAYVRSYLWCGFHHFPKIDQERWEAGYTFDSGDVLVVIAPPSNLFSRVTVALASLGLIPTKMSSMTIVNEEEGPYEILVVSVAAKQS